MDCMGKLVAVQQERFKKRKKKKQKEREERGLLTSFLKEPFTRVDTLEWLEGLSESWEKEPGRAGTEERKVK